MATYVVALTGASGAAYGINLICELLKRSLDVDMIVTETGALIAEHELGLTLGEDPAASVIEYLENHDITFEKKSAGVLRYFPNDDLTSPQASGSALKKTMIICPCSMGTLARIATGISKDLVERAADCVLKERGTLVVVPRETPLNQIHLENMLRLSQAGAIVAPAMPAFYHGPKTTADMVAFMTGKILDLLEIENDLFKRWNGEEN